MTLDNNHILLLDPIDEKPHIYENSEVMAKYQHGDLSVSGNIRSIACVFRVVDEYCLYDSKTYSMITTTCSSIKETSKVIIREKLYESFDHIQYHKDIIFLYSSIITCKQL